MKAFSRFEKEILQFYPYVTKGNVVVSHLPSVITKRKNTGKNAFIFIWETGTVLCKTFFKLNH